MNWIKCKYQQPPFDEDVLIPEYPDRDDMYKVFSARLSGVRSHTDKDGTRTTFNFYSIGAGYDIDSDYWMPMPKPPIDEAQEETPHPAPRKKPIPIPPPAVHVTFNGVGGQTQD